MKKIITIILIAIIGLSSIGCELVDDMKDGVKEYQDSLKEKYTQCDIGESKCEKNNLYNCNKLYKWEFTYNCATSKSTCLEVDIDDFLMSNCSKSLL